LNNKGQFSIIAALLVAVVLISTVIITYSTIRNSPIQDQPQILSAIDETNFAIKQILGFTVGYYGSVLKVTGNSSYARTLAINYLHSGLVNIANMHPEWGASFNVGKPELHTYWFTNASYSMGNLAVTYNLTGLGIHGITYETSCRLKAEVEDNAPSNQTQVVITKDEGEPLINLGKQNFNFYRYIYTTSTWELITPSSEPVAFANGTYILDIPSGIDPDSFLIQVEDPRGLIVVASSFNRYTCTLIWNPTAWTQNYVDNNTSDVDSSADKGTHSNFPAQQAGPDSLFDTLTEEDTLGSWGDYSSELLVNPGAEFGNTIGWVATGPNAANFDAGFDCPSGTAGPHTGSYAFYWNNPSSSSDWAYQEVDLSPWLSEIQSGEAQIAARGWLVCSEYHVPPWDVVRMKVVFCDNSSQEISSDTYDTGERGDLQMWTEFGIENHTIPTNAVKVTIWFQTFENNWDAGNADGFTIKVRTYNSGGNYELDLEVQWTNVNYNRTNEELCIYGETMGSENIQVDVWNGSAWENLFTDLSDGWNNVSVSSYLDSTTLTIRFKGSDETSDTIQDNWKIDATLLHVWPTEDLYLSLQDATIVVELLQNGTMRWLGQNLQLTTQAKPIPPIPVKAIHINQTINNINREAQFQIEDWTSNYRIPLGLTSNVSVFNSRTMLVFLVNPNVSKVTIWWDGHDTANQTSYAITNKYFTSNTAPSHRTLSNGILTLKIDFSEHAGVNSVKVISTVGTSTSTSEFMRVNNKVAHYGHSEPMYAVLDGVVRVVLQHEVEWSGGIPNCPNVYAHIVLTLPANATYYTYQLRFMFIESQRDRIISDLCPIKLTDLTGQPQTENGTANGYPTVSNSTGLFYNFSASSWAHHWSQFISDSEGAGIMFTDSANQMLYVFDSISGNETGALKVSNSIELLSVASELASVNFTNALDVTWHGAVVTFDGTTPIYKNDNNTGLWIIIEYPPTITVTTES